MDHPLAEKHRGLIYIHARARAMPCESVRSGDGRVRRVRRVRVLKLGEDHVSAHKLDGFFLSGGEDHFSGKQEVWTCFGPSTRSKVRSYFWTRLLKIRWGKELDRIAQPLRRHEKMISEAPVVIQPVTRLARVLLRRSTC